MEQLETLKGKKEETHEEDSHITGEIHGPIHIPRAVFRRPSWILDFMLLHSNLIPPTTLHVTLLHSNRMLPSLRRPMFKEAVTVDQFCLAGLPFRKRRYGVGDCRQPLLPQLVQGRDVASPASWRQRPCRCCPLDHPRTLGHGSAGTTGSNMCFGDELIFESGDPGGARENQAVVVIKPLYELNIRDITPADTNVASVQTALRSALHADIPPDINQLNNLDVEQEYDACATNVLVLTDSISDLEDATSLQSLPRLRNRLAHLERRCHNLLNVHENELEEVQVSSLKISLYGLHHCLIPQINMELVE
ncbi:hypothetical protein PR048_008949 [Dryococelus australis]|uniref:Uncharacterized protein n=1 Tax=Dryococelus australis TaxID=614101 RepID=A0ABQ9HZL3_9NEOP|nr:hypothetical protein PR048_008949 [Dryococelus australis]